MNDLQNRRRASRTGRSTTVGSDEQFRHLSSHDDTETAAVDHVALDEVIAGVPPKLRGVARRIAEGDSLTAALDAEGCHRMSWNRYVTQQRSQRSGVIEVA